MSGEPRVIIEKYRGLVIDVENNGDATVCTLEVIVKDEDPNNTYHARKDLQKAKTEDQ